MEKFGKGVKYNGENCNVFGFALCTRKTNK